MKRSEPMWKRKAARLHCKQIRDQFWGKLSSKWARTFVIGDVYPGAVTIHAGVNIVYDSFYISDLDIAAGFQSLWTAGWDK